MSTKITNGLGGTIAVTDTPQTFELDAEHLSGNFIKFWNTGFTNDAYFQINVDDSNFTVGSAAIIPAEANMPAFRDPLKKFTIACASGETTTVKWSAL